MKKITFLSFSIFTAIICLSNLDGALPGNTNAPGEFTCGRAPCHNVNVNIGDSEISIFFGDQETTYQADSTYSIKVQITEPLTERNGFQILALDENFKNAGTWELIEPDKMKIISGFSNASKKYVTHLAPGNQQSEWIMNWKAPAEDVGKINFYASVLSANDNGENTGDEVYNTNISVDFAMPTSTKQVAMSSIKVYPTISTSGVWVELPWSNDIYKLSLFNTAGRSVSHKKLPHGGTHFFDIQHITPGLYFLKIEKGKEPLEVKRVFVR